MMFTAPDPVVTWQEAARLLGCGKTRLFELLAQGVLERAPRYGRSLRIFRASVERALFAPRKPGRKKRHASAPAVTWTLADVL